MGSHDEFMDTETWSMCMWEAEAGGLPRCSGRPGLHSKILCLKQSERRGEKKEERKKREERRRSGRARKMKEEKKGSEEKSQ